MLRRFALLAILLCALPLAGFERQPNADYRARREKLAAKLGGGVLVLFASTEEEGQNASRGFRQNDWFYYLTGWREPGAGIVIAPAREQLPYTEALFLPARNVTQERWTGPKLTAASENAASVTGFDRVLALDDLRDELVRLLPAPSATVYTDLDEMASTPSSVPIQWLRRANAFPNYVSFADAKPLIADLRMVKDAGELALLRKSTEATVEAHKAAMRAIRPGMSENELAAIIEYEYKRRGAEGPAFSSIAGSGFEGTVLHYSENSGTLDDGELVVLDVGGEYSMYASDVTRTLPVNGKFTPRQREIYDIVLGAQKAAVDAFKLGESTISRTAPGSLYKVAMEYINAHGKDRNGQPLGQYFIHGLSHFVGLAVHDAGDNSKPLPVGAVFTIEPGIYIPEEKLGVRIEDTYVVKADGTLECLSCGAPKSAEAVERAIATR